MQVIYFSEGEYPCVDDAEAMLTKLMDSFEDGEVADNYYGALDMCGVFFGTHEHGRYVVISFDWATSLIDERRKEEQHEQART